MERLRMITKKNIVLALFYLIYGFIYSGWFFHKSSNPIIFSYSLPVVAFLCIMFFVFFIPPLVLWYRKKVGQKAFLFAVTPVGILLLIYIIGSFHYYYSQEHLFDPFLQHPNQQFDNESIEKKPDTFRIITLGGSTTRCASLPPEKRYPSALEKKLQEAYPNYNIEVLNAGMDWFTTKHSLMNYTTYCSDWKPDLVVVMHAVNDLYRSFSPVKYAVGEYNAQWTHYYGASIKGAVPPAFEEYLLDEYLKFLTEPWFSRLRYIETDIPLEKYKALDSFERHLTKLVDFIHSDSSEVVLVTQPFLYKAEMSDEEIRTLWMINSYFKNKIGFMKEEYPTPGSLAKAMNEANSRVKEIAAQKGVPLADGESGMEKSLEIFVDDVHYTVKGADLLAEIIAQKIKDTDMIDLRLE
jgi:lysophospholipase L1-like esterase/NADH:ubiquinone oxidoreductase subunit 6 (subunit J)